MTNIDIHFPAECADHDTIMIAWPGSNTDWCYMLDEARDCFRRIIHAIARYENVLVVADDALAASQALDISNHERISVTQCPINDTWARDFGPITVVKGGQRKLLDFKFNGWGLKFAADCDNLITSRLCNAGILPGNQYACCLNFVLEGGSIESNGEGTILTTSRCLLSPNRNGEYSRDDINRCLHDRLGATDVIWLDHGAISGDDTDSHIDTLARFVGKDTVMYVAPPSDKNDDDYAELAAMKRELELTGLNLIPLPYAGPVYDPEDGSRLPATYANFLITPRAVFVPTYDLPTDAEALSSIGQYFADRDVIGIDCRPLIRQHGSLHCVTMQLYLE